MNTIMFIEIGTGIDLHGQDVTVAAVRACRDAIGRNSMPGLRPLLPDQNLQNMKVNVILGVPFQHDQVDIEAVKNVFPYGEVSVQIKQGGLLASSGVIIPEKGDRTDELVIINAVVEVGF